MNQMASPETEWIDSSDALGGEYTTTQRLYERYSPLNRNMQKK